LNLIIFGGIVAEIEFIGGAFDGPFPGVVGPIPVHGTAPGPFNDVFTINMNNGVVTFTSANLGLLGSHDTGAGAFYADWGTFSANTGLGFISRAYKTIETAGQNNCRTVDFRGF
jgi:hypothetical protein